MGAAEPAAGGTTCGLPRRGASSSPEDEASKNSTGICCSVVDADGAGFPPAAAAAAAYATFRSTPLARRRPRKKSASSPSPEGEWLRCLGMATAEDMAAKEEKEEAEGGGGCCTIFGGDCCCCCCCCTALDPMMGAVCGGCFTVGLASPDDTADARRCRIAASRPPSTGGDAAPTTDGARTAEGRGGADPRAVVCCCGAAASSSSASSKKTTSWESTVSMRCCCDGWNTAATAEALAADGTEAPGGFCGTTHSEAADADRLTPPPVPDNDGRCSSPNALGLPAAAATAGCWKAALPMLPARCTRLAASSC